MPDPINHYAGKADGWNYDMSTCPAVHKVCLLTFHGIQIIGQVDNVSKTFYAAWGPLYKRDKVREAELGLRIA